MADRLARIFGTEEDKVNCSFYFKIGACRHGDSCTKLHNKPLVSQTIMIHHMYQNTPASLAMAAGIKVPEEASREAVHHFEDFYEEVFAELTTYGEVEEMIICDNIGDHLIGNLYVKYAREEQATHAKEKLEGRFYAGRKITCEYSPVTDFKEARCRQYDDGSCSRGGHCNFMHLKPISRKFKKSLFRQMYREYPEYSESRDRRREDRRHRSRSRNRSRSRERRRHRRQRDRHDYSRSRSPRGRDRDREADKRRDREAPREESPRREMTSEERLAMIARWNEEEDVQEQTGPTQG